MRLTGLMRPLKDSSEFKNLTGGIRDNKLPAAVFGLSESARSYLINGLYEEMEESFIVFANSDVEAKDIYEDLSFYLNNVYYFPSREAAFYNVYAVSGDLRWERLKVIRELLRKSKKIIVTSIESLAAVYIPFEIIKNYIFKISLGDTINLKDLGQKLIECGYERVDIVDGKGQFSVRGGILDVYSPIAILPYRIELYGDEIDSIRSFNLDSQRSLDKVNNIELFPAKEIILSSESLERGYKNINEDLTDALNVLKNKKSREEYDKIKAAVAANLEALKETWSFETIDGFLPYFYEETSSFLDYMENGYIIIDDLKRCLGKMDSVYFEFEENYKSFLQRAAVLKRQNELLVPKDIILQKMQSRNVITLESIPKSVNFLPPKTIVSFSQITLNSYLGQLDLLIEDVKDRKRRGFRTIILSGTRPRGERLVDTLRERGIESGYKDIIKEVQPGEVVITFGNQLRGFDYPDLRLSVISDKEVFGLSKLKRKKAKIKGAGKIKSFTELKLGDYVVHTNHGIGVYKGIKQLEVEGIKRDYLYLSYDKGDSLYVPVEQLDLVQKYIGSEGKTPKISKLGGTEWTKAKNKVKQSINEIAEDIVKLYAMRSTLKGHVYSKDTVWQKQFEEEFPYDETPDQLTAISDIKADMESDKPMDRLLCGDVGYGKTEVAVRAAFKAIMDGRQVAVLVPTTILAEQHYNNFTRRFSDFPVKIDMVSRFRTAAQQKVTLKALKEGNVDLLIGTHRILQKDIQFKDLGLLIVDEEQRFGVTHKEKIKTLKKNVDVLTLTATPIPRTLHMSLVGVRDISVIETPPEDRYPIQTYVVEYNDQLIRDAVMREIGRGGQVYFVYNRVETIKDTFVYLSKLLPEANIAVAHGQMTERELEAVMLGFMKNEYNVLISTTIIETGIDIPNVNTMIIYDADKMGLSQLYQLRGRVGRSNRIAYAYFTYRKDKILTEVAEKRLKAIKDFTELGSGFKIALRDLEIRGAGNMMGSAQHGHMAAVGYDLYCRMLEEMISKIKGDIVDEPVETTLELKIDAYIPGTYIEDEVQKIEVYKKIAAINSYEDMMDVQEEIEDRFSDIPQSVYNLMNISYLRSIGRKLGISEIKEKGDEIYILMDSKERINEKLITGIIKKYSRQILFKPGEKPCFAYKLKDTKKDNLISELKEVLEFMKTFIET